MAHSIEYYVNQFQRYWGKSIKDRHTACKFYAAALNSSEKGEAYRFCALDDFKHWTDQKWRQIYIIGCDIVIPEYLDYKPGITEILHRCAVSKVDQADIFGNGLNCAAVNGTVRNITIDKLQECHIAQVYLMDGSGNKRDVAAQVIWLQEHIRPVVEVLENHCIRVGCATIITPDQLFQLLIGERRPLGPDALMAAATYRA